MLKTQEQERGQRAKVWLQALILSGTLNLGLLSTLVYMALRENPQEAAVVSSQKAFSFTNEQILQAYSRLSFADLQVRLESDELVEEGYTKRDLALACLVAFHHLAIDKALGGIPLQKRVIAFRDITGEGMVELVIFAGLHDAHFGGIIQFMKTERWPLTSKGLFLSLTQSASLVDPSLLEAFYCTVEFHSIYALVQKYVPNSQKEVLLQILRQGSWRQMKAVADLLRSEQEYTEEVFKDFLVMYALEAKSTIAADYLLQNEEAFILKKFEDQQVVTLLDLYGGDPSKVEKLAKELLLSRRNDAIRKRAALALYQVAKEPFPEAYDYKEAVVRFCSHGVEVQLPVKEAPATPPLKGKVHKVQERDSLWKIAKKYGVSIEAIKKCNHLETDKLRVGKELQIPEN
ncbi:MAG: LysM peptidoglycan-binding domain-containing protein [Chlamydiae bacterium]|nr:LysM peptidoglycan-binding domain-containing protein [Chlamydiota bacterium]